MGNILVKFSRDWADRFPAEGLAIYTPERYGFLSPKNFTSSSSTRRLSVVSSSDVSSVKTKSPSSSSPDSYPSLVLKYHSVPSDRSNLSCSTSSFVYFGQIMDPDYVAEAISNTIE